MLKKIKNKIARKAFLHLQKNHFPEAINTFSSIGLIIDPTIFKNPEDTKKLIQSLKGTGSQVETIFISKNNLSRDEDILVFKDNQISWRGNLKSGSDADKFQRHKFDVLINYFNRASPHLLLLSAAVKAKLKIGLQTETNSLNDLNIVVNPNEIHKFVCEFKTYIPKIN